MLQVSKISLPSALSATSSSQLHGSMVNVGFGYIQNSVCQWPNYNTSTLKFHHALTSSLFVPLQFHSHYKRSHFSATDRPFLATPSNGTRAALDGRFDIWPPGKHHYAFVCLETRCSMLAHQCARPSSLAPSCSGQ